MIVTAQANRLVDYQMPRQTTIMLSSQSTGIVLAQKQIDVLIYNNEKYIVGFTSRTVTIMEGTSEMTTIGVFPEPTTPVRINLEPANPESRGMIVVPPTVVFEEGETRKNVPITVVGDPIPEKRQKHTIKILIPPDHIPPAEVGSIMKKDP